MAEGVVTEQITGSRKIPEIQIVMPMVKINHEWYHVRVPTCN